MTWGTSPRCAGGITMSLFTVADTVLIPPVPPNEDASSAQNTTQPKTHPDGLRVDSLAPECMPFGSDCRRARPCPGLRAPPAKAAGWKGRAFTLW